VRRDREEQRERLPRSMREFEGGFFGIFIYQNIKLYALIIYTLLYFNYISMELFKRHQLCL
jgi:hypothetical protein